MRNIRHKTRALDRPRFIQEKQKNLAYIMSNVSGDLHFLLCSNTFNPCSRMQEMHSKSPKFSKFSGGAYPQTSLEFRTKGAFQVVHSPPTPTILPPTQIPTENPVWNSGKMAQGSLLLGFIS